MALFFRSTPHLHWLPTPPREDYSRRKRLPVPAVKDQPKCEYFLSKRLSIITAGTVIAKKNNPTNVIGSK